MPATVIDHTKIRVTKTGCIIMRNSTHVKMTPNMAEQYLKDQAVRKTRDKLPKLDKFRVHTVC